MVLINLKMFVAVDVANNIFVSTISELTLHDISSPNFTSVNLQKEKIELVLVSDRG